MKQGTMITKIVVGLLLITALAYLVFSGIKLVANPHEMMIVYEDRAEESLNIEGWCIREELRLQTATGLVNYRLDEGEKASTGQLVAVAYKDQKALLQQQEMRQVSEQFAQLNYAMATDSPSGKVMENQLLTTTKILQIQASKGDFSRLSQQGNEYKQLILRREYLTSDEAAGDLGRASLSLSQALGALQGQYEADAVNIHAPQPGVFSTFVDGYESLLRPELLEELDVAGFQDLVSRAPASNDGSVGKLVTSSEWHLVLVVDEATLPLFQKQSNVAIRSSAMSTAIKVQIASVGQVKDGQALVLLSSRENMNEIMELRQQVVTVIFNSEEGIRIPKTALRVAEDGSTGVFAVAGYRAELKPVNVLAEDGSDYIVEANPKSSTDKRVLRSGDEIILSTEEMYDGKVVR